MYVRLAVRQVICLLSKRIYTITYFVRPYLWLELNNFLCVFFSSTKHNVCKMLKRTQRGFLIVTFSSDVEPQADGVRSQRSLNITKISFVFIRKLFIVHIKKLRHTIQMTNNRPIHRLNYQW